MRLPLSIALICIGMVMLVFGLAASPSFASSVSSFLDGLPSERSMWLLIGGAGSVLAGMLLNLTRRNT